MTKKLLLPLCWALLCCGGEAPLGDEPASGADGGPVADAGPGADATVEGEQAPSGETTGEKLPFEDSAFGIFGTFAATEYGYFKERAGMDDDRYWSWVEGHVAELGAHWTRSNLQLFWDVIEPELGQGYVWDNMFLTDPMIKRIYGAGNEMHFLGVFHEGGGPTPRSDRPPARNPLDDPEAFKAFVTAAVERYDGDGKDDASPTVRVKYWQAGNEVFGWQDSGRTVEDYIEWVRLIRQAARTADPGAKLVLIAPTSGRDPDPFLLRVIEGLADEKAFEVIDLHHWGTADQWKMSALPQYRQRLDQLGLTEVQIWSCEHGTWQGQPEGRQGALPAQTEQDQARSLIRRYVWNLNNGLDKLLWNNLMEWKDFGGREGSIFNSMGLVTDGEGPGEDPARFNTERVAYWSYRMLAAKIDRPLAEPLGAIADLSPDDGVYGYAYRSLADGQKIYILWSEQPDRQVSFSVSASRVQVTNLVTDRFGEVQMEREITPTGGRLTLELSLDPLLVQEL